MGELKERIEKTMDALNAMVEIAVKCGNDYEGAYEKDLDDLLDRMYDVLDVLDLEWCCDVFDISCMPQYSPYKFGWKKDVKVNRD